MLFPFAIGNQSVTIVPQPASLSISKDVPYGRTYSAVDPEGHPWFFTTPPKAD